MQITPYVDALQNDLAAVAALGNDAVASAARQIGIVLEPALRQRLLDAVTDAAHELTSQVPSGHVEVRIEGGDPKLVFVEEAPSPAAAPAGDDAHTARITLRLPELLKTSVDEAAAREGISVNTDLVQLISRHADRPYGPQRGKRLVGFAES